MASNRLLIDYLPPYMQEYTEMREIMNAEQPEFDSLWSACERVLADQFILDATEYGVMRWESMLKITPKGTDSLDVRKFRILTRLNQELPYTMTKLKEALTTLCGADGFSIDLQADKYHIDVKLALGHHSSYQAVVDLLNKMIPANLTQYVKVMYNTNSMVKKLYRHMDLTAFTHNQIRSEVFEDA
jgi:hypothetical protein